MRRSTAIATTRLLPAEIQEIDDLAATDDRTRANLLARLIRLGLKAYREQRVQRQAAA